MFNLRLMHLSRNVGRIFLTRSLCSKRFFVELLNKRTVLKLSGPDTNNYLQSMMTNDIRKIDSSPTIFSLLLNSSGRVLYEILLYKIDQNEYLIEYDSSAFDYLDKHLIMYRLRKNVKIEPLKCYSIWAIYPDFEATNSAYQENLNVMSDSLKNKNGVIVSVIDPRTNLLGVRVITTKDLNLLNLMSVNNFKFIQGDSYRTYRYKLGIGEGVMDHPPGSCLPFDTNVDFMNGVSFNKGCYLGQELTARIQFTLNITKRLMPVILEPKDTYPEFPPECTILNEKKMKMGRLRSHLGPFGLALLKYEESLKSGNLIIKDFDIKLKTYKPKWWPENV